MSIPPNYVPLHGSVREPVAGAKRVAPADSNEKMSVTIHVRRRPGQPATPAAGIGREAFTAAYGADPGDLKSVEAFATSHGLTVDDTNAARRTVVVSGTVAQMNSAFSVDLGTYDCPRGAYRGREGPIHIPRELEGIVESVLGLDNRPVAKRGSAPTGATPLTPPQVAALYSFPTGKATGQTIGIIELSGGADSTATCGYAPSDIQLFFKNLGSGFTTPVMTDVSVDGAKNAPGGSLHDFNSDTDPDLEVVLDIDVAGSVAQGASIAMYFAPNTEQGFSDAILTAVHPNKGQPAPAVISISWAGPEEGWTAGGLSTMQASIADAQTLHVTILVSSGDNGSDCGVGDGKAHVEYPGSDPGVICCGGTTITKVSGSSFTEGTWNDDGATGGGVSGVFTTVPSWQSSAGLNPINANTNKPGRGVPDVSGNASSYSGYELFLYGESTKTLKFTSGQGAGQTVGSLGGTSAVSPLYAGLVALLNAHLGKAVGYLNPALYALGAAGVFRDVHDGRNNEFAYASKPAKSYTSVAGWDPCTGWGSINGAALLAKLAAGATAAATVEAEHAR